MRYACWRTKPRCQIPRATADWRVRLDAAVRLATSGAGPDRPERSRRSCAPGGGAEAHGPSAARPDRRTTANPIVRGRWWKAHGPGAARRDRPPRRRIAPCARPRCEGSRNPPGSPRLPRGPTILTCARLRGTGHGPGSVGPDRPERYRVRRAEAAVRPLTDQALLTQIATTDTQSTAFGRAAQAHDQPGSPRLPRVTLTSTCGSGEIEASLAAKVSGTIACPAATPPGRQR